MRLTLHVGAATALLALAGCGTSSSGTSGGPCPEPTSTSPGPPPPGPVMTSCIAALPKLFDDKKAIDASVYQHLVANMGRADGIAFRYGPDASCVQAGPPRAKAAWAAPHRLCKNENPGFGEGYTYEVGGACNDDAGYGSTQGPVIFDADAKESDGVDWIQYMAYGFNVMAYRPVPSWTWGGHARAPFFTDDDAIAAHGGPFSQPVSLGRSPGNRQTENDQGAVIGFADGALRCLGTNTGPCDFSAQLPKNKLPVAISATSDSEFVVVLVWDTAARTSELAVFAMTSNYALGTPGGGVFPGLTQGGDFHTGKLLGFVALPDLQAATSLAANSTRGNDDWWHDTGGAQQVPNQLDLSDEPTRQLYEKGGKNFGSYGVSGLAVIASKYEKKVTFVDLQPLFDYFNAHYFGARSDFDATQDDAGDAPDQWPFTFDVAPTSKPVVVTTVPIDDMPTAVFAGWRSAGRTEEPVDALVATMNGKLHRYALGGLVDATAADAKDIHPVDVLTIGRNPTAIVESKHGDFYGSLSDVVIASRGDREIEMISYATGKGVVSQRISDARMNDPISVYDSTRSKYVITVADYTGRRVLSYRYGPFVYQGQGGPSPAIGPGPKGKDAFDFGGSWATAGRPFGVTATNVN